MHTPADILNNYLKGNYKNSINEEIARYFIVYLADIPYMKLTEVAEKCHVSTPTVIRFCREIGFLDFTDFKKCVYDTNIANKKERYRDSFDNYSKDFDYYRDKIFDRNKEVIDSILKLNLNKVDEIARDIAQYRYVYVLGTSLSMLVGEYLRIQLVGLDKNIITLSSPKKDIPLSPVKEDTLGIVISQCNNYFESNHDVIPYLKSNCKKIWLITQTKPEKSYKKYFDNTLFVNDSSTMLSGYHILLHVSEIIVEACSKNY